MTKPMLIDATHAEETRVVVLDSNRIEDFDVETSTKKQLKGNIYLAKVVRVEPSLQAAFVEYGGNRHGFLAFNEIHPDYYQIPVADRQRLLEQQAEEARRAQAEEDQEAEQAAFQPETGDTSDPPSAAEISEPTADDAADGHSASEVEPQSAQEGAQALAIDTDSRSGPSEPAETQIAVEAEAMDESGGTPELVIEYAAQSAETEGSPPSDTDEEEREDHIEELPPPETIGGEMDTLEDSRERRPSIRFHRNYKIQEVIKRRQILLVQVVKEERGTKGAALTTYISLAGRFCVLMPNSPRGGGISRKITSAADRRRLKEVMAELDLPEGMGLIVRTAGANRPKPEIKRDCEYLLRLWDDIREHTMRSVAPALIYEEANLIKRAIRDLYSRDIDEIIVDGEEAWKAARDFMRMLMPSHVKKVQLWRDGGVPLFARHQIDAQLDAILSPTVQLRSGGYLVINQAEALVAIDVNSGRSTRERGIEETALRTNLEAADEVARQIRLRDLAGLIVIDFIDMESRKHNSMVERRLKEALKVDRARIQVGHISHFGLLEMSRQRLRPSLAETSLVLCPHCSGMGHVRSTESAAIHVLRGIEEEGAKRRAAEIVVRVAPAVAMYVFNHKRERLYEIESRTGMRVLFEPDAELGSTQFQIERVRAQAPIETLPVTAEAGRATLAPPVQADAEPESVQENEEAPVAASEPGETAEESERRRRRRRRRRRGGRRDEAAPPDLPADAAGEEEAAEPDVEGVPERVELGYRSGVDRGRPARPAPQSSRRPPPSPRGRGSLDGGETRGRSAGPAADLCRADACRPVRRPRLRHFRGAGPGRAAFGRVRTGCCAGFRSRW